MTIFRFRFGFSLCLLVVSGGFAGNLLAATSVLAGEADVVAAEAFLNADGTFRIEATVSHADTGWAHYANSFEIVAPDGTVLSTRVLAHPHVDEQPFTRGLGSVAVPAGIDSISIRAHDLVHEYGGLEFQLDLPGR